MFPDLKKDWVDALRDPHRRPTHALMLLETKSPWGRRQSLQPTALDVATDAAAATLIGPEVDRATTPTYRKLQLIKEEIVIVEQLDYWYQETDGGDLTDDINEAELSLLINGEQDVRLPAFPLNEFANGSAALKFGKLPLGWILPREATLELVLTPNGTSGGEFDLYVDLLIRREPLWLMQEAGLVEVDAQ